MSRGDFDSVTSGINLPTYVPMDASDIHDKKSYPASRINPCRRFESLSQPSFCGLVDSPCAAGIKSKPIIRRYYHIAMCRSSYVPISLVTIMTTLPFSESHLALARKYA